MKIYITKANDSFASIAKNFGIKDENYLKTFHNLSCSENDIIHGEPGIGKQIFIPEDPQFLTDKKILQSGEKLNLEKELNYNYTEESYTDGQPSNEILLTENKSNTLSESSKKDDSTTQKSNSSEHDGKYFVIQKGTCQCNQGFKFPKFKVTSHQKHYWNNVEGQADYLAVTEDDLQLDPAIQPFGQCKLKPTSGGYLPCNYAPAGKWQKTYEKVKIVGKSCLTEISELTCVTGGKITVLKHGQQSGISDTQISNANPIEQQVYNPLVNIDELKDEMDNENNYAH